MGAKDLYTIEEARERLGGISRNTIYKLLRSGKLASVPIGRRRFIPGNAIESFVAVTTTTNSPSLSTPRSQHATETVSDLENRTLDELNGQGE